MRKCFFFGGGSKFLLGSCNCSKNDINFGWEKRGKQSNSRRLDEKVEHCCSSYFSLEDFKERCGKINLDDKFPNLADLLKERIKKLELARTLQEGFTSVHKLLSHIRPPYAGWRKVFGCLDGKDLAKLNEAAKLIDNT